jgi:hypothetical protein
LKPHPDDHVITLRSVRTEAGDDLLPGTHGFVLEARDSPHEHYLVEMYVPIEALRVEVGSVR